MIFPIQEFENLETPFYYYDLKLLESTLKAIKEAAHYANYHVHYAVKANANPEILRVIQQAGLGVDCVSGGEIKAALNMGFAPSDIVFAGVGKSDREIEYALKSGIGCFNVESIPELEVIQMIASRLGCNANVALRVNPDIDAHTHHYITTGLEENKFGISMQMLEKAISYCYAQPNVKLTGLHFHIGSQITTNEPFRILCERINDLVKQFAEKGVVFTSINVGGGLGIDYDDPDRNPIPDFKDYFDTFNKYLKLSPEQHLHFELGRSIVAQCGSLITRVLYVKEGLKKKFVIVDAGMTDLIRPALYQAHHKIENITSKSDVTDVYDVVGPICESSDCFGQDETLPLTKRGDLLALRSAGAYGEIMASQYNCRNLPGSFAK